MPTDPRFIVSGINLDTFTGWVNLINQVMKDTKQLLGLEYWDPVPEDRRDEAVAQFNAVFSRLAKESGINPHNIPFNLQAARYS